MSNQGRKQNTVDAAANVDHIQRVRERLTAPAQEALSEAMASTQGDLRSGATCN
jgi:hypothetical protein